MDARLTPAERAHMLCVLRLFVSVRLDNLAPRDVPPVVRALARGRFVSNSDLWRVGAWCGLSERELYSPAQVATRRDGRVAA